MILVRYSLAHKFTFLSVYPNARLGCSFCVKKAEYLNLTLMDDLFGQIECRSKSDSIVMRILRSAMDKAHEKVQSKDGPIEFLHERSTFYELAAILVEGGLNIVQEETDILEGSCDKILSDLIEIRHWLQGRIQDMKSLIVEKDIELMERSENELKLRQALELKERELANLYEKIEPERLMNEGFKDFSTSNGATEGDISKLKSSVDKQVWSIKQKLEDEEKCLTNETKKIVSNVSSPNLSFNFLYKERNETSGFTEEISRWIDRYSIIRLQNELSRPEQNILIRRMSSDIDILKETLDLAFGKMQSAEVLPLEKQWRWTIERDIESILMKGFISNIKRSFDVEMKQEVGLLKDNWVDFFDEMRALCHQLKRFFNTDDVHEKQPSSQQTSNTFPRVRRTSSEPKISFIRELPEEDTKVDRSNYSPKVVTVHDSVIRKQRVEWNRQTREVLQRKGSSSLLIERDEDNNRQERRIHDVITRLDNLVKRNANFGDKTSFSDRNNFREGWSTPKSDAKTNWSSISVQSIEEEIEKLKEERDGLCLQISLIEDTYQLLFQGILKDISTELCLKDTETLICNGIGGHLPKKFCHLPRNNGNQFDKVVGEFEDLALRETIGSLLKEDVYMVFFKEMAEAWKLEKATCALASLIREDIYQFVLVEALKDLQDSVAQKLLDFQENTHQSRKPDTDDERTFNSESENTARTPHQFYTSKELLMDLEQSLKVSDDVGQSCHLVQDLNNIQSSECVNTYSFLQNDDRVFDPNLSNEVLAPIIQFQQVLRNVELAVHENLENKCLRLEVMYCQVGKLIESAASIRTRKFLYRKAFISRCHNLSLAESEVDVLGDQVEALLCLLEKIYTELNQNALVLSRYFEVFDILKLIKRELNPNLDWQQAPNEK